MGEVVRRYIDFLKWATYSYSFARSRTVALCKYGVP